MIDKDLILTTATGVVSLSDAISSETTFYKSVENKDLVCLRTLQYLLEDVRLFCPSLTFNFKSSVTLLDKEFGLEFEKYSCRNVVLKNIEKEKGRRYCSLISRVNDYIENISDFFNYSLHLYRFSERYGVDIFSNEVIRIRCNKNNWGEQCEILIDFVVASDLVKRIIITMSPSYLKTYSLYVGYQSFSGYMSENNRVSYNDITIKMTKDNIKKIEDYIDKIKKINITIKHKL